MNQVLEEVIGLLTLERIEDCIFRGESRDIGSPQVFGGQVLGQALNAAAMTVEDRVAHSLHAYFLRRGDFNAPIVFEVDQARDGGSFSNRRVIAIQHGRQIFNMTASFQAPEQGLEHQFDMPSVPGPETLQDITEMDEATLDNLPGSMRRFLTLERPIQVRPVDAAQLLSEDNLQPIRHVWMRAVDQLPDDPAMHRALLAYISDYELLATAALPHGLSFARGELQMASLDHAMWFHRSCRVDEWLLFSFDSPSATGARGLARSQVFCADGQLVASTAQEGLIRVRSSVNAS